jgi:hypothetical protein
MKTFRQYLTENGYDPTAVPAAPLASNDTAPMSPAATGLGDRMAAGKQAGLMRMLADALGTTPYMLKHFPQGSNGIHVEELEGKIGMQNVNALIKAGVITLNGKNVVINKI